MTTTLAIPTSIELEVAPERAWTILAKDFGKISSWASVAISSEAVPKNEASKFQDAEVDGRLVDNEVGLHLKEMFVAYDKQKMTFTYLATGSPFPVSDALNTWTVHPIEGQDNKCKVTSDVELHLNGTVGWVVKPVVRWIMAGTMTGLVEDFKLFAEKGEVGDKKRKQLKKVAAKK